MASAALRGVTAWLARTYGPAAVQDLAEELAVDLAEAFDALAAAEGRDPCSTPVPRPATAGGARPPRRRPGRTGPSHPDLDLPGWVFRSPRRSDRGLRTEDSRRVVRARAS